MTEPQDPFDTWLHAQVDPLSPPPGTFEQIRTRARRRKARRALLSAASAGAAAGLIVLAAVALPRVVPSVLHVHSRPAGNPSAAGHSTPPAVHPSGGTSASVAPTGGGASTTHGPVPPNFAATSVTFVSRDTGWVIGQAGTPGACYTQYCTSVARTDDAGQTWYGLPAPLTGAPDGGSGVSQIRFIDDDNGWAFGPQLWATHDGGQRWTQVSTGGLRVTGLETVGAEAFAVFARCTGGGADFAAGCTGFTLYSSPVGVDDWQPVAGMGSFVTGTPGAAKVVLTATRGYLYTPDGMLLSGAVSGGSAWQPVSSTPLPCAPGAASADGQPSGGQLAAAAPGDLALACPGSDGQVVVWVSSNGGQSWRPQPAVTVDGTVTSLAAAAGGVLALATSQGLYASANDGQSWRPALSTVTGGFSYVGLTTSRQGVAVPAEPGLYHSVWFSFTGGQAWTQSRVTGG